ncbi:MAG: hypothetical protein V3U84_08620 [Thiotrichaceae bacterium]
MLRIRSAPKIYDKDPDTLDDYLKQLAKNGRVTVDEKLKNNDPVALRIEWTRDRIDEGLQSLVRVNCRIEHWFDKEWPKGGCP